MALRTNLVPGNVGHVGDHNHVDVILNSMWANAKDPDYGGGAVMDGVHDDTSAFVAASTAAGGSSGAMLIPDGAGVISAPIPVVGEMTVMGLNWRASRLYLKNGSNCSMIVAADDGIQRDQLTLERFCLAGNASGQTGGSGTAAVKISGVTEVLVSHVIVLQPYGDGLYFGGVNGGYCYPFVDRCVIVADPANTHGNGINLDSGSSDAQVNSCDIGFFKNGAGVLGSGHPGAVTSSNDCWQCLHGFYLFSCHRWRMLGELSDYADRYGFLGQNSDYLQLTGCQSRDSSRAAYSAYDGFYFEYTATGQFKRLQLTGCSAFGGRGITDAGSSYMRFGLTVTKCDWLTMLGFSSEGHQSAGDGTGVNYGPQITHLFRCDHNGIRITDGAGLDVAGFDSAGRWVTSQAVFTATAGASGAPPGAVQGYVPVKIQGGDYRIAYYNP